MSGISPKANFHSVNGQNLVSEHSVAGVPASLYNLTKSVPDPLVIKSGTQDFQTCLPLITSKQQ